MLEIHIFCHLACCYFGLAILCNANYMQYGTSFLVMLKIRRFWHLLSLHESHDIEIFFSKFNLYTSENY